MTANFSLDTRTLPNNVRQEETGSFQPEISKSKNAVNVNPEIYM